MNQQLEKQMKKMRLKLLSDINDSSKDELFTLLLEDARQIALSTIYPYDLDEQNLPERVENNWIVRCAIELYKCIEDGSYISYSENGLSWTKSNELIPSQLINELTPKAGVPK